MKTWTSSGPSPPSTGASGTKAVASMRGSITGYWHATSPEQLPRERRSSIISSLVSSRSP